MLEGGKEPLNEFYTGYSVTSLLVGAGLAGRVMQKLGAVPRQLAWLRHLSGAGERHDRRR